MMNFTQLGRFLMHGSFALYGDFENSIILHLNPIYRTFALSVLGSIVLLIVGATATIYEFPQINIVLGIITNVTILLCMMHTRYLARVFDIGALIGRITFGKGDNFFKRYIRVNMLLMMTVTCIFGTLTFIKFTWLSFSLCTTVGLGIGLSKIYQAARPI